MRDERKRKAFTIITKHGEILFETGWVGIWFLSNVVIILAIIGAANPLFAFLVLLMTGVWLWLRTR